MDIQIKNTAGEASGTSLNVSDDAFGCVFNEALVHQVVIAYLAGGRAGTKAQKSRADVRGGGAKPWRQKGTGRARAGTSRSPIWRSGGVTFAARPRSHAQKVNRKMYRSAMRAIFSELLRQERITVVEEFSLAEPKTGLLASRIQEMGLQRPLIVVEPMDTGVYLAGRNIPGVEVTDVAGLNPANLVGADQIVMTVDAFKRLEEKLS